MRRPSPAAIVFASLIAGCHGHAKPCDGAAGAAMSARWQGLGLDLPADAVVCESSPTRLVVEAPGDDLVDLEKRARQALESKRFALDPQRTADSVGGTLVTVGLHRQILGVEVTAQDIDPIRAGVRRLQLDAYPACAPDAAHDPTAGGLEARVKTLLAGEPDDGFCTVLRYELPGPGALPRGMQDDAGYRATYDAFTLEPTALLDALAAARAEGRKDVKVWTPSSFDDPVFDGVRARLSSMLGAQPPTVVEVSGKVLGYVASLGSPDHGDAWIAPLDAIKIVEPPARPHPKHAAAARPRPSSAPNVYVVHPE